MLQGIHCLDLHCSGHIFLHFNLLNYLLSWFFHSKQTEIPICIFSKKNCSQEPVVWLGFSHVTAHIDTSLTHHPLGAGRAREIVHAPLLRFLSCEHCYLFILFSLDNSSENHLSSRFAFLLGMLLDFYSYCSLLSCTLERWEWRCQNGLVSSKGQLRENGCKGSLEVTRSNPPSGRDAQGHYPRTMPRRLLNIARHGVSTNSLGKLYQCLVTRTEKKEFLMFK